MKKYKRTIATEQKGNVIDIKEKDAKLSAHYTSGTLKIDYFDFSNEEVEIGLLLEMIRYAIINGVGVIEVYPLNIRPDDFAKEMNRIKVFSVAGFVEAPTGVPYGYKMVYKVPERKDLKVCLHTEN